MALTFEFKGNKVIWQDKEAGYYSEMTKPEFALKIAEPASSLCFTRLAILEGENQPPTTPETPQPR